MKDHVTCLFHVPINLGRKVVKDMSLIEAAHAEGDSHLMLSDDKSPWGADIFIGPVPMVKLGIVLAWLPGTLLLIAGVLSG